MADGRIHAGDSDDVGVRTGAVHGAGRSGAGGLGLGPSWVDVVIAVTGYVVTGLGVTVGFHRYLTHGAFKSGRPLRIVLAVAGSLAVEGPVIGWVADHRRHHAFADRACSATGR